MVFGIDDALIMAGGSALAGGLSGFFGGKAQEDTNKAQIEEQRRKNKVARGYLSGYGYTPYQSYESSSAFGGAIPNTLKSYLSGELSPAQRAELDRQRQEGMNTINTMSAGMGTPGGARLALSQKLGTDIAMKAATLADERQRYGLEQGMAYDTNKYNFGLQDYLRGQEAKLRGKELMAQYA